MHLPTVAALITCAFFATTHALPTPGTELNSREIAAADARQGASVAGGYPPAWKRTAGPPDWRRSADASANMAREAAAIPPPDWRREVATNEAGPVSPDWKREASDPTSDASSGYPKSPSWRRAENYPSSPPWRRETTD